MVQGLTQDMNLITRTRRLYDDHEYGGPIDLDVFRCPGDAAAHVRPDLAYELFGVDLGDALQRFRAGADYEVGVAASPHPCYLGVAVGETKDLLGDVPDARRYG